MECQIVGKQNHTSDFGLPTSKFLKMEKFTNNAGSIIVDKLIRTIQENKQYLSDIDGLIGDGDHGINMNKGFTMCREELDKNPGDFSYSLKVLAKMLEIDVDLVELTRLADETREKMKQAAAEAMGQYIDYFTQPIWEQGQEEDGEEGEEEGQN